MSFIVSVKTQSVATQSLDKTVRILWTSVFPRNVNELGKMTETQEDNYRKQRVLYEEDNRAVRGVSFKVHNPVPHDDLHTLQQQTDVWMPQ